MLGVISKLSPFNGGTLGRSEVDPSKPPRWFYQRSSKWFVVLTCSFAVFTDIFLYGVIVPVIPFALMRRIGVAQQDVQHWVSVLLTAYGAALLVGSPIFGWWADKTATRRWPFLSGLIALTGSTLMLCLAKSIGVLLVARILQGLSAAVAWTVSTVVLTDRAGPSQVGECMGWVTLARSIAIVAGPLLGGVVYARAGYYAVFAMCFAFLFVDITLRLLLIEATVARQWDSSIGLRRTTELSVTDVEDERKQAKNPYEQATAAESYGSEAQPAEKSKLYRVFHRLPATITLLGSVRMLVALWGCLWQATFLSAFDATLPLFLRHTFGWDSSGAGLMFLALVTPSFISPVIGWMADKHGGGRWWAALGYATSGPIFVFLRFVNHNSLEQKVLLSALLALLGGLAMFFEIPVWVDVIQFVDQKMTEDPQHYGGKGAFAQAYGLANFFFALGFVIGPLWGGFVYHSAGWGTMNWTIGLVSFLSAFPTAIWIGGNIFDHQRRRRDRKSVVLPAPNKGSGKDEEKTVLAGSPGKGTDENQTLTKAEGGSGLERSFLSPDTGETISTDHT